MRIARDNGPVESQADEQAGGQAGTKWITSS